MVNVKGYWIVTSTGRKLPQPFASKKAAKKYMKKTKLKGASVLHGTSKTTKNNSRKIKSSDFKK